MRLAKMWLIFPIFLAIFTHSVSGAPVEDKHFWQSEPCSVNEEITKSFSEAKKMCNLREMKLKESDEKICNMLEKNFDDLCKSGKIGEARPVPPGEDICEYDIIKTESLVEACQESCKDGNVTLCEILIQIHELLTPKLGENGGGLPPVSLPAKKENENISKTKEIQNLQSVPQEETQSEVAKIPDALPPSPTVSAEKVATNALIDPMEHAKPKENNAKSDNTSKTTSMVDEVKQSVALDNHMDEEALQTQSQFFSYFVLFTIICIVGYIIYFNKKKILALILEGRRKNSGGRSTRRSSSAQYRKLDNNLEEAMADNSDDTIRHVIY